ncbi:hypothetical protein GYMLUDRAFT_242691 [Collybiopsis luxurians FD-317 M1]|uniref:Uncharacterized protein n=1 Tax=Collybiopsis luxurians FD-317 M1 TaxID=944289 RepID=A0A0D0D0M2_9AGAR|nr:hypothetical protein GYMLUDRAFT_242691 [Collybiopsis luxurians FD-317 M1]
MRLSTMLYGLVSVALLVQAAPAPIGENANSALVNRATTKKPTTAPAKPPTTKPTTPQAKPPTTNPTKPGTTTKPTTPQAKPPTTNPTKPGTTMKPTTPQAKPSTTNPTKPVTSSKPSTSSPSTAAATCPYKGVPKGSSKAAKLYTADDLKKALQKFAATKKAAGTKPKRSSIHEDLAERDLVERASANHPSAQKTIKLYHGTSVASAQALAAGSPVKISDKAGEFTAAGYSGFYLTDMLEAAAQYARQYINSEEIAVLEYTWNPTGMQVKELDNKTPADRELAEDFMLQNMEGENMGGVNMVGFKSSDFDMISGPHAVAGMNGLTSNFWQYAITRPNGMKGLSKPTYKVYDCKDVPTGELPYLDGFQDA